MRREELLAQTPAEVADARPGTPWRIADLHALKLPVVQLPVERLSWLLELPLWQEDGKRFQLTPAAVAADPGQYPHHYERVMAADLGCPIHCVEHQGRLVVLDGVHRLLQAQTRGHAVIDAMILTASDLDRISR